MDNKLPTPEGFVEFLFDFIDTMCEQNVPLEVTAEYISEKLNEIAEINPEYVDDVITELEWQKMLMTEG